MIKLLINMEKGGAVDGARNRFLCPLVSVYVQYGLVFVLWCPATAGTSLAPGCQVM